MQLWVVMGLLRNMAILIIHQQKHLLNNNFMQYFDLIFNECKKINNALESAFIEKELFFISANISEVVYGLRNDVLIFCYYPERYEHGKIMLLKDVILRFDNDKAREYSLNQLSSFFQNDCKFYEDVNIFKRHEEYVRSIIETLNQCKVDTNNEWEQKFILYKKSISAKWD